METGMTVAYELIRSKRRTIAIVIDSEGKCRVRAPLQARLSDIEPVSYTHLDVYKRQR